MENSVLNNSIPQSAEELALRMIVLAAALMLDWLFGEPDMLWRRIPHPVVLFGQAIGLAERFGNRKKHINGRTRRMAGMGAMIILTLVAGLVGIFISLGDIIAELLVLTILLASRSLDDHIRAVCSALEENIQAARDAITMIVGRDTNQMDDADIARAAIETGAESLSDGVIAPAFWFLLLGLPGLLIYKMTNTADSMIGYRNARYLAFGWAAARFDDFLNYVPARLTALLICVAAATSRGGVHGAFASMWQDAGKHQSPNAGWPEAAMAGGIDVWLAGPRRYGNRVRHAARLHAEGKDADRTAILGALRVLIVAQILFALALVLCAISLAPDALI